MVAGAVVGSWVGVLSEQFLVVGSCVRTLLVVGLLWRLLVTRGDL